MEELEVKILSQIIREFDVMRQQDAKTIEELQAAVATAQNAVPSPESQLEDDATARASAEKANEELLKRYAQIAEAKQIIAKLEAELRAVKGEEQQAEAEEEALEAEV